MTKPKSDKRGLGRGLSALMADTGALDPVGETGQTADAPERTRAPDSLIPIENIHPNPDQPRRDFTQTDLDELAASIREKGILQPLLVRADPQHSGHFQIVAGERRWRAAQMAMLHEIPVLIRDLDDSQVLEFAIIENIQRADLNAVEEAQGYRQLMDKFGHTQEQLATVLSKSRSHIANLLRLLNLPPEVQEMLIAGKLSAGHARTLVTAENPIELAKAIVRRGLSVRQAEKLAKPAAEKPKPAKPVSISKDADTKALELDLSANLGMSVSVDHNEGAESGTVKIRYDSLDQLDELCRILTLSRGESA